MALTLGEYLGQYLPDLAHLRADGARLLEEMTRERSEQQAKLDEIEKTLTETQKLALQDAGLTRHQLVHVIKEETEWLDSVQEGPAAAATAVESSPMIEEITRLVHTVQRYEALRNYLGLLIEIDKLVHATTSAAANEEALSGVEALARFRRLQEMQTIAQASPFSNLQKNVDDRVKEVYSSLHKQFSSRLLKAAEALSWPKPKTQLAEALFVATGSKFVAFKQAFVDLLRLQDPLKNLEKDAVSDWTSMVQHLPSLDAMTVLMQPILLRFQYHFEGKRPTNRDDKPEWCFTYVLNLVRDHTVFLCNDIQSILNENQLQIFDARILFIRDLVSLVSERMSRNVSGLSKNAPLLAHTVHESLLFDHELRDVYGYPSELPGASETMLDKSEMFWQWLGIEIENSIERFNAIKESPTAFEHHYREVGGSDINPNKPTESAEKLIDLLQSASGRMLLLKSRQQQVEMFDKIQLALAEQYASDLSDYVEEAGRYRNKLSDKDVVRELCRFDNSARHVKTVLHAWAEQVEYLELFDFKQMRQQEQQQASSSSSSLSSSGSVSSPPLIGGVRSLFGLSGRTATSTSAAGDEGDENFDRLDAAIWDDVVRTLEDVDERARALLVDSIVREFVNASSTYFKRRFWSITRGTSTTGAMVYGEGEERPVEMHPDWIEPLDDLQRNLSLFELELSSEAFELVWKDVAGRLDDVVMRTFILNNRFEGQSVRQLRFDMSCLVRVFRVYAKRPENYFPEIKEVLG